jgi:site-specific DNA recombinase
VERGESYDRGFTDKDPDYLLTGLIRCRHCHRNYVGAAARGKGHRYRYYTCWTRQRYGKDACTGERIRADVLEKAVFTALLAIYADPELLERAIAAKTRNTATAENSKTKSTTAASNSADASLKRSSKTSS